VITTLSVSCRRKFARSNGGTSAERGRRGELPPTKDVGVAPNAGQVRDRLLRNGNHVVRCVRPPGVMEKARPSRRPNRRTPRGDDPTLRSNSQATLFTKQIATTPSVRKNKKIARLSEAGGRFARPREIHQSWPGGPIAESQRRNFSAPTLLGQRFRFDFSWNRAAFAGMHRHRAFGTQIIQGLHHWRPGLWGRGPRNSTRAGPLRAGIQGDDCGRVENAIAKLGTGAGGAEASGRGRAPKNKKKYSHPAGLSKAYALQNGFCRRRCIISELRTTSRRHTSYRRVGVCHVRKRVRPEEAQQIGQGIFACTMVHRPVELLKSGKRFVNFFLSRVRYRGKWQRIVKPPRGWSQSEIDYCACCVLKARKNRVLFLETTTRGSPLCVV